MPRLRLAVLLLLLLLIAPPAFGQDVPLLALDKWMWYNEYGWEDLNNGRYDRAEQKFRQAIKIIEPYPPGNRKLMARTYCDLARVFYYEKRYSDAEPLAKWRLPYATPTRKPAPTRFFSVCLLWRRFRPQRSTTAMPSPCSNAFSSIQEKELTGSHVNTLVTLERLAFVLRSQGKYHEAEPLYRRAIAIHERNKPDENIELADIIDQYVILLRKMNRIDDAEIYQARALRIRDTFATKAARAKADQQSRQLRGFK